MSKAVNISEFKQLINSIKDIGLDSESLEEKKVVQDLVEVLKYICEFDILSYAYDNSEEFNSIIPNIDAKLALLDLRIQEIKNKYKEEGSLTTFEMRKLQAARMSYNRYQDIKDAIETRNFEHYVDMMNKNLSNASQIIAVCSSALSMGEKDFSELFGEKISDEEHISENYLNILYRIVNNHQLISELKLYFKRENGAQVDSQHYDKDNKYLEYLRLAKKYFPQLREYIAAKSLISESGRNKESMLRARLGKSKLELDSLSEGFFASIRNHKERVSLQHQIDKDEEELARIENKRPQIYELESTLKSIGLAPVIDAFDYKIEDKNDSPEQAAVDYLKANLSRTGLDITSVENKVAHEMSILNSRIEKRDSIVNGAFEHLSPYAQKLVTNFHDDVVKILDIIEEKRPGGITPLLAAYVLKALVDAKNISYEELNNIIRLYDSKGIHALVDSYENVVMNTTNNINDNIAVVDSRPLLDIKPFEELKIK